MKRLRQNLLPAPAKVTWAMVLLGTFASFGTSSQAQVPSARPRNLDPKEISESVSKYEELVRERPDSAEMWSNLGVFRAMAGNCQEALPALERAQQLDAKLYNPWFFSGYCQFARHQAERANESLQRAVRLNPRDPNAWFLKAQVSNDLGKFDDSLDAIVHSQALIPNAGEPPAGGNGTRVPTEMADPDLLYLAGKDALELATRFYDRVMEPAPQPDFHSLMLDGERNAALSSWDSAINKYQDGLKILPNRPDLHFALGSAFLESGRYAEAENSFRRSLELTPDSAWTRLRLALALIEESKTSEATRVWESVGSADLSIPAEYQDYLACAYLLKQPESAQRTLHEAQAKFLNHADWQDWSDRLGKSPAESPGDALPSLKLEGLTGVGLSLRFYLVAKQAKGNVFEALFSSQAAYRMFRSDFLSGKLIQVTGQMVPILKFGKQTASTAGAYAMGEILQTLSYGFYERLGAEFPDSSPAMKLAAENLSAMGDQQKALEIYQAILQRDGPSPEILGEIARIYWSDHKWEQALEVLQPLSQMDPNDATTFVNIGRIYVYEQKTDSAASAFEHAIRLDPRMTEAHFGLGQVLRKQGNFEGALRESKIAVELDPMNPNPHYLLSQIYSKLGDKDLAAREMASFQQLGTLAKSESRERNRLLVPVD